jgi:hypothetical protein
VYCWFYILSATTKQFELITKVLGESNRGWKDFPENTKIQSILSSPHLAEGKDEGKSEEKMGER